MVDGFVERERLKRNDLIANAWYGEAFARTERLPRLDSLMTKKEAPPAEEKEQTPEEMMAVCRVLNMAFGGQEITT